MRKYISLSRIVLILLLSVTTQNSYSQNITNSLLKEINYRLAEGLECKAIVLEQSNQIDLLGQSLTNKDNTIEAKDKQIVLLKENNTISEGRERAAMAEVQRVNEAKEQAEKDVKRLRKARNRYAWIAGIETLVIAGIVYLSIR